MIRLLLRLALLLAVTGCTRPAGDPEPTRTSGVLTPDVTRDIGDTLSAEGYVVTIYEVTRDASGLTIRLGVANARTTTIDVDPALLTVVDTATGEQFLPSGGTLARDSVTPGRRIAGTVSVPVPETVRSLQIVYTTPHGPLVWQTVLPEASPRS